jgi:hypothetical protein
MPGLGSSAAAGPAAASNVTSMSAAFILS